MALTLSASTSKIVANPPRRADEKSHNRPIVDYPCIHDRPKACLPAKIDEAYEQQDRNDASNGHGLPTAISQSLGVARTRRRSYASLHKTTHQ
jgi:hypothetical protein